ncbi:hypothetical protein CC80DRAFT_498096 [Byssothecium circinans]|uniref:Uncharacterized protein n=1 Tax=Byssothecium circinans TaxID=147558 RepID=A0A6A5T7M9_9PLEO|nr:hypothetical protein CC80DRAFT_498193 [Byssothecium circinans]KAF1948601.1 hypothetical protein CC80DRAFT_498096 [Byssothecium circinans]
MNPWPQVPLSSRPIPKPSLLYSPRQGRGRIRPPLQLLRAPQNANSLIFAPMLPVTTRQWRYESHSDHI